MASFKHLLAATDFSDSSRRLSPVPVLTVRAGEAA
jgi:hypothetical protein